MLGPRIGTVHMKIITSVEMFIFMKIRTIYAPSRIQGADQTESSNGLQVTFLL
jgi:hypothetical protein